jgi:hypothetical protein
VKQTRYDGTFLLRGQPIPKKKKTNNKRTPPLPKKPQNALIIHKKENRHINSQNSQIPIIKNKIERKDFENVFKTKIYALHD